MIGRKEISAWLRTLLNISSAPRTRSTLGSVTARLYRKKVKVYKKNDERASILQKLRRFLFAMKRGREIEKNGDLTFGWRETLLLTRLHPRV